MEHPNIHVLFVIHQSTEIIAKIITGTDASWWNELSKHTAINMAKVPFKPLQVFGDQSLYRWSLRHVLQQHQENMKEPDSYPIFETSLSKYNWFHKEENVIKDSVSPNIGKMQKRTNIKYLFFLFLANNWNRKKRKWVWTHSSISYCYKLIMPEAKINYSKVSFRKYLM